MRFLILVVLAVLSACATPAAPPRDPTPRTAVISAFPPELAALAPHIEQPEITRHHGVEFTAGRIAGQDVVVFMSGMSMVNAAMTTQMALDRFNIQRIVFSGIAGGVDPSLDVGDVVVASQWGQYLETVMARETPDGYRLPPYHDRPGDRFANFQMMYPEPVEIARAGAEPEQKFWFAADPALLDIAAQVAPTVALKRCPAPDQCLSHQPRVVVGGNGVSGPAFVDNAAIRDWAFATFQARVLDMESAAVAHVAYANATPFIAFRSLSDLAGGDPEHNQARTFFQLASENSAAVVLAFLEALN
jgi:adenosylhomocysteine nucleosidase